MKIVEVEITGANTGDHALDWLAEHVAPSSWGYRELWRRPDGKEITGYQKGTNPWINKRAPNGMTHHLEFKFNDPKDAMMFKLMWSQS